MLKYLPNMLACQVSIMHNAQGPNNTITESDVAGTLALGEAFRIICRGQADFFLVGGAESKINPLSMARLCLFESLSHRNDAPEKACRPFDRRRDGLVWVKALGCWPWKNWSMRAGAVPASMPKWSASAQPLIGNQSGDGLARARPCRPWTTPASGRKRSTMSMPTASSTVAADAWEARALQESLRQAIARYRCSRPRATLAIWAPAGGPAELIASLLAFYHGAIPATLNYEEPDPACQLARDGRASEAARPALTSSRSASRRWASVPRLFAVNGVTISNKP